MSIILQQICNVNIYVVLFDINFVTSVLRLFVCLSGFVLIDLPSCVLQHGEKMSDEEVKLLIKEADVNHDGKLDYQEVSLI